MTQEQQIEYNKEHGLLCACNQIKIPYGDGTGEKTVEDGVSHGYEDCVTL